MYLYVFIFILEIDLGHVGFLLWPTGKEFVSAANLFGLDFTH